MFFCLAWLWYFLPQYVTNILKKGKKVLDNMDFVPFSEVQSNSSTLDDLILLPSFSNYNSQAIHVDLRRNSSLFSLCILKKLSNKSF